MSDWTSLNWEEKNKQNKLFLKELPASDDFGSISVIRNGRNVSATIDGSARVNHFRLLDAFEEGELPEEFNLGTPEFNKSAKPLDFIEHFFLDGTSTVGWFMSKRARDVFECFNLGNHRFYPMTVTKNGHQYEYFLLAIKTQDDSSIDFSKSSFYFGDSDSDFQLVPTECGSLDEYHTYMNSREYGYTVYIAARNIILNTQFDKLKDIIDFNIMKRGPFLSKRLNTAIVENKLTGISVNKESNIHLA